MLRESLALGFGCVIAAAPAYAQGYGYWPQPQPYGFAPYGPPMQPAPVQPWPQIQQAGALTFPPLPDLRRIPPQPRPITPPSLPFQPPVPPRQFAPSPNIDAPPTLPMPERIPFAKPEPAPPSEIPFQAKPPRGWAKPTDDGPTLSAKPSARVVTARPASRSTEVEVAVLATPPNVALPPATNFESAGRSPASTWYGRAEYLYWFTANQQSGPLAVLGYPGGWSETIGGRLDLGGQGRSGGRFLVGRWLGEDESIGLEVDGFFLGQRNGSRTAAVPSLALPFADPVGNVRNQVLAAPGGPPGVYNVSAVTNFWGIELDTRLPFLRGDCWRFDGIAGARYLHLGESLQSNARFLDAGGNPQLLSDRFETSNDYWLAQLGLDAEVRIGRAFLQGTARFGLGADVQTANLSGGPNGFLVQASNAGGRSTTAFAWVPEFGVRTGADLTSHIRATVGYTFLLVPNAVRPGDVIDPVQGSGRPAFAFSESSFWAQGISGGVEFRW
jgi:hypothetical protein